MRTVAVLNQKGGVGKTTVTLGLASGADASSEYSFVTELLFQVANIGSTALTHVQVRDRLNHTFPAPAEFVVLEPPVASLGLTGNPNFDGNADAHLLLGEDTLASGDSGTIRVVIGFNAAGSKALGDVSFGVSVSGSSPTGGVKDVQAG